VRVGGKPPVILFNPKDSIRETAGWDKRPWEGERGLNQKEGWYFPDRTPEAFGEFMRSAIDWIDRNPDRATKERMVLIYAWNEFGEGGYIAPTKGDPEGKYLKALKAAIPRQVGCRTIFALLSRTQGQVDRSDR
jgi:hypothetical protein